jgi:hypothetical protein
VTYRSKTIEEMLHLAKQAGVAVVLVDPTTPERAYVQNEGAKGVSLDVSNNGKETRVLIKYEGK